MFLGTLQTLAGEPVMRGNIQAEKLRPAQRNARAVLFLEPSEEGWLPLKLD